MKKLSTTSLTLMLLGALCSGCTQSTVTPASAQPGPGRAATPAPSASPVRVAAGVSPAPVELFDGRMNDGQITLPGASLADQPAVEAEVKAHLPQLGALLWVPQGEGLQDLEIRQAGEGSFIRAGAKEKLYVYRLGSGNGFVAMENGKVVGHFAGFAGDYAMYTYAVPVDANADGLTDLLLFRNVEDGDDIYASLFLMKAEGPRYAGSTSVFLPAAPAGEEPAPGERATAYLATIAPGPVPRFQREVFERPSGGAWRSSKTEVFELESNYPKGYEPRLTRVVSLAGLDEMQVQKALEALSSYTDVPSALDLGQPANAAQRLVLDNGALRLMELLDTRAAVYAVENATGHPVDHARPGQYALSLQGLKTVEEIRDAYIRHTNESLGGMSPYPATP